jgi:hypothetical protein
LESRLVGLAHLAKRAEVGNGNAPALPALSEPDIADVENFLREMLLIFPILEITAFQLSAPAQAVATEQPGTGATGAVLHLAGPSTAATGRDTPEGFVVSAGSHGRLQEVPSMHEWLRNIRKSLMSQGILVPEGDLLVVTQDYVFDSPSSAAGVLLGRAANGRTEWKDGRGNSLKHLQAEALRQPGTDLPQANKARGET